MNGNLKVTQDLPYQRLNNTFAIDDVVDFNVSLTDRFLKSPHPRYEFFWFNGTELIKETKQPFYQHNFTQPGVLKFKAHAYADFAVSRDKNKVFTETIHLKSK